MPIERRSPSINDKYVRTRVTIDELRDIESILKPLGDRYSVETTEVRADSVNELVKLSNVTLSDLTMGHVFGLTVHIRPTLTVVRCSSPNQAEMAAAAHLKPVLMRSAHKPRFGFATWVHLTHYLVQMVLLSVAGIGAIRTFRFGDPSPWFYFWLLTYPAIIYLAYRTYMAIPEPDPVILKPDLWDKRPFLQRRGVEFGLALSALSLIVAIVFGVLTLK